MVSEVALKGLLGSGQAIHGAFFMLYSSFVSVVKIGIGEARGGTFVGIALNGRNVVHIDVVHTNTTTAITTATGPQAAGISIQLGGTPTVEVVPPADLATLFVRILGLRLVAII